MSLRVVHARPPNFEMIAAVLPQVRRIKGIIFTYGTCCYLPDGGSISDSLLAHERVHSKRQLLRPSVEDWWADYLTSTSYRFEEELLAHKAELAFFEGQARGIRRQHLRAIARRLSGPLYGHMVTHYEAKRLIAGKGEADA